MKNFACGLLVSAWCSMCCGLQGSESTPWQSAYDDTSFSVENIEIQECIEKSYPFKKKIKKKIRDTRHKIKNKAKDKIKDKLKSKDDFEHLIKAYKEKARPILCGKSGKLNKNGAEYAQGFLEGVKSVKNSKKGKVLTSSWWEQFLSNLKKASPKKKGIELFLHSYGVGSFLSENPHVNTSKEVKKIVEKWNEKKFRDKGKAMGYFVCSFMLKQLD